MSISVDRENIEGGSEEEGEGRREEEGEEDGKGKGHEEKEKDETEQCSPEQPSLSSIASITGTASVDLETAQAHTQGEPTVANPTSQASQPVIVTSRPSHNTDDIGPTKTPTFTSQASKSQELANSDRRDSLVTSDDNSVTQAACAVSRPGSVAGESSNSAEGRKTEEEQRGSNQSQASFPQTQIPVSMRDEGSRGRRESRGGLARLSLGGRGDGKAITSKLASIRTEMKGVGIGVGGEKGKGSKKDGGSAEARKTRSQTTNQFNKK